MNLYKHFPHQLAAALEQAIEQHPLLAEALYTRVTKNLDLTDNWINRIHRGTSRSTEDTIATAQAHRERYLTKPQPQTQLPKPKTTIIPTPKPPPPPKPTITCAHCKRTFTPKRPNAKYCSTSCAGHAAKGNLRSAQPPKPKQPKPPKPPRPTKPPKIKAPTPPKPTKAPKPPQIKQPTPTKLPPIVINHITHNGIEYASTQLVQEILVHNQPDLMNHIHFQRGTIWSLYGARYPIIRRIDIGHERMTDPIPLWNLEDCARLVDAYRRGRGAIGKLPRYTQPTSTRLERITIDGIEWMRFNEAISILAGIPIETVINVNKTPYESGNLVWQTANHMKTAKAWFGIPRLQIGVVKRFFYRTIDILPHAGKFKDGTK